MKENIPNIDISINDRLKEIRELLDLTQSQFAKVLEVKQSYYSDVENGKREVTTKLVKNLITIFQFSANWLFTGKGDLYITNVDKKDKEEIVDNEEIDIHRKINANNEKSLYQESSDIPFNLELHIDKKLIIDFINLNNDTGKLYEAIHDLTTFGMIIELLDIQYFSKIRLAEKNRNPFYAKNKFDYEGFRANVIAEVDKLMRFMPALEKVKVAINEFYEDIKDIDEHNTVNEFFGRR